MSAAILLAVLIYLSYKYSTRKFDYWKNRNVFFHKPIPFLGNLLDIMKEPLGHSLLRLSKAAGNRDFFGIFIFDRPILVIKSRQLVRAILQKDSANFIDRTIASNPNDPVLSNALFFQKNPAWKHHRSKLSPIFTSGKLKLMFHLMVKEGEAMAEYIRQRVNIPDIESKEICSRFSTNVLTRCAFAVDANSFTDENAIFRNLGRKMFEFRISTALRQMGVFFAPGLCELLKVSIVDPSIITTLKGIFTDVLHTRMTSSNPKGNDFVDILLEAHKGGGEKALSEEAMLGQALQFFGAGVETVASTLSFALYELCINPEMQEKVRNEIMESIEKNNGLTYESLHELEYLDMCISETLRKYPAVPFLDRKCKEDYKIEGSDFVIEKGMPVYIPTYEFHYNPNYFPNPETFDPERFADKSNINKDGLYYFPFGDGPRICIGNRFALIQTKIGVISILSKYRMEVSETTPIPIEYEVKSFILQSTVGIPLKFVPI